MDDYETIMRFKSLGISTFSNTILTYQDNHICNPNGEIKSSNNVQAHLVELEQGGE